MKIPFSYIKQSSREAVIAGLKHNKRYHFPSNRIVSSTNPLVRNGVNAVSRHADLRNTYQIKPTDVTQFLAASSLSHLLDGWMYLANAFNSMLAGDEATAIHLAYYAELRSAMSILSTEGIAVFSDKHISALSNTTSAVYPANFYANPVARTGYKKPVHRTHQFVWDAIDKWSSSNTKLNSDILKVFKVQGRDFYELTEFFHPATAGSSLLTTQTVKKWLKEWCFDISNYKGDRENRNESSYRPQRIKNFSSTLDFKSIINDLGSYWDVISPTPGNKFALLDKYLLRKLFSQLHTAVGGGRPLSDLVNDAFTQQGIHDHTLLNFLDSQAPFADDHIIFQHAAIRQPTALSILARATLLLRVSVGLVSQLYKAGMVNKTELGFVWAQYAVDNGFWSASAPLTDFDDLWGEISLMLEDLKIDINTPGSVNDIYSIRDRNPKEIISLSQINRACMWGLDF
jgi:hypothetical protein